MKDELTLRFENANAIYSIPTDYEIQEYNQNKDDPMIKHITNVLKERFFIKEEDITLIQLMPFSHKKNSDFDEAIDLEKFNANTIKIWIEEMSAITKEYMAQWNTVYFDGILDLNVYIINGQEYDGLFTYYRYVMGDIIDYIKYNPRLSDTVKEWAPPIIGARFLNDQFGHAPTFTFPMQILYSVLREVYHVHDCEYNNDIFNSLMRVTKSKDNGIMSMIRSMDKCCIGTNTIKSEIQEEEQTKYSMVFASFDTSKRKKYLKPTLKNIYCEICDLIKDQPIDVNNEITLLIDFKFQNKSTHDRLFKFIPQSPTRTCDVSLKMKISIDDLFGTYLINTVSTLYDGSNVNRCKKIYSEDKIDLLASGDIDHTLLSYRVANKLSSMWDKSDVTAIDCGFEVAKKKCKRIKHIEMDITYSIE